MTYVLECLKKEDFKMALIKEKDNFKMWNFK